MCYPRTNFSNDFFSWAISIFYLTALWILILRLLIFTKFPYLYILSFYSPWFYVLWIYVLLFNNCNFQFLTALIYTQYFNFWKLLSHYWQQATPKINNDTITETLKSNTTLNNDLGSIIKVRFFQKVLV